MENLKKLFEEFIREKRFIKNITLATENYYDQSWLAYQRYAPPIELSKVQLVKWVMAMREADVKPTSCNTYISAVNTFLRWLHENEHIPKPLRAEKLKVEENGFSLPPESQLELILRYQPRSKGEHRTHTIMILLIDTGLRITEVLEMLLEDVDFEQMLVTAMGKGRKKRTVPISVAMRKKLWLYVKRYRKSEMSPYLFSTITHGRLNYNDFRRDMHVLLKELKLTDIRIHPHCFRHFFSIHFLRRGGDLFRLSKILGHTSIATIQIYLRAMGMEIIQEAHMQFPPLSPMNRRRP
jgi:integrase/recombinase XerD